jgi:SAM-dependent methyltransferase
MENPFEFSGIFYDLLYSDKDSIAEVDYVVSKLREHGVNGKRLLEYGSGTGRHGYLLGEREYNVLGLERSQAMINKAPSSRSFISKLGDITSTKLAERFDAVLALFHVMSYQTSNATVKAAFENAAFHLERGGLFLFDFWYGPAVTHQKPEKRLKIAEGDTHTIIRLAEPNIYPNENRVDVKYTYFVHHKASGTMESANETHQLRYFTLPEIDLLADFAGFERVSAQEWRTCASPSNDTWGLCVVLRKT